MSKRSEAVLAAAQALIERERAYEIEMDARIISESALIRAGWSKEEEWSRRVTKFGRVVVDSSYGMRSLGTERNVRDGHQDE